MNPVRQAWKRIRRLFYKSRRVRNEDYFRRNFPNCQIHWTVRLPKIGKFEIGQSSRLLRNVQLFSWHPDDAIVIGKYSSLAVDALVLNGGNHELSSASLFVFRRRLVDGVSCPRRGHGVVTEIGHDVWIAARVTIIGPLTIGHGAIAAAGAVVTKDVPPYAIVAGVPAKIMGYRAPDEHIEKMLKIAWWDWPLEIVKDRADDLDGPLEAFVEKYYRP